MGRKQVGQIDEDLLAEVDRRAAVLGQTRRVYLERMIQATFATSSQPIRGLPPKPPTSIVIHTTDVSVPPHVPGRLGKGYVAPIPKKPKR